MQSLRVIVQIPLQWDIHRFRYFETISLVKTKKKRGNLYPPGNNKKRNHFDCLSVGVDKVLLKSVRLHVAWLPGAFVETISSQLTAALLAL